MRRAGGRGESDIEGIFGRRDQEARRPVLGLVFAALPVLVLAGAWAGIGYALGRRVCAAIGAGAGLVIAALLRWIISRLRIR